MFTGISTELLECFRISIIDRKDNEVAAAVFAQAKNGVPMPNIAEMGQVWEPMAAALQLVATNKQDAQKSADDAVKQIKQPIEANNQ
jgi:arabinogalactan oligomer/maltooligosaccharide transport system substrate-binding protein